MKRLFPSSSFQDPKEEDRDLWAKQARQEDPCRKPGARMKRWQADVRQAQHALRILNRRKWELQQASSSPEPSKIITLSDILKEYDDRRPQSQSAQSA